MSRVIALVSFMAAFFIASASTKSILGTINGVNAKTDDVEYDPENFRLPPNLQRPVDASNADLQRQMQAIQDNVQMQMDQTSSIFDKRGSSSRKRSKTKSGYATSAANPPKQKPVKQGDVTSNPYLD